MVLVNTCDHVFGVQRKNFDPIYLGDKTAIIRPDVNGLIGVGHILELREEDNTEPTGRICEVEVTHIDQLSDGIVLLSITLCA